MSTIYNCKNILLTAIFLLVFAACGAPDAYENEVDGGVEYGENTRAVGYTDEFDSTAVDPNDSLYIDSDGTYPPSMDAERNGDGIDEIEEGLNDTADE